MKKSTLLHVLKNRFGEIGEKELFARVVCGEVFVDGIRIRDPKYICMQKSKIIFKNEKRFVSRGGEKLAGVLSEWKIDCSGKIIIDCGASTGGFTDCLLTMGAKKVYAIDVGYSQFDYKLRNEQRVKLMERTNISSLKREQLNPVPEFAVVDLSFKSLSGCISHILDLTLEGWALALVKPQFEWKNPPKDFNGIVIRREDRRKILEELFMTLQEKKILIEDVVESVLKGKKGNVEYFIKISKEKDEIHTASMLSKIAELFAGET